MAKATKGLRGQIAEIRAGKRAMDKEAGGDYGVAKSADQAGVANLNNQLGRINRQLLGTTKRTTKAVGHLTQRAKEVERQTRARQNASVSRYGTSLGASASQQFQTARATSAAGVQGLRGARTVAARGANMAQGVIGIAAQGAKAQKASGDYALAQALQARYTVSAETAFAAEQELRLQQLQFEQQKKLQDLENKEASGGVPGVTAAVSSASGFAGDLMDALNSPIDKEGNYGTATDAANKVISDAGIVDPNEAAMVRAMASKMWAQGAGYEDTGDGWTQRAGGVNQNKTTLIATAAKQTFGTLYPQMWKQHSSEIIDAIGTATAVWGTSKSASDPDLQAQQIKVLNQPGGWTLNPDGSYSDGEGGTWIVDDNGDMVKVSGGPNAGIVPGSARYGGTARPGV